MKILLYADWLPAFPYLEPIYDHFTTLGWECSIYFPVHNPVDAATKKLMTERGYQFTASTSDYDWVICPDEMSAAPHRDRINVFHGPGSKSNTYCKNRTNPPGYHVAFSDYYRGLLTQKMQIPHERVIKGGLVKFDILTDEDLNRPPRDVPKVLYAPTFNSELSAINVLGDSINEIEHVEHRHHTILNHNFEHVTRDIECCHSDDKSQSFVKLMADADIVIADFASATIEALALGKMVIQVQNPGVVDWHTRKGTTGQDFNEIPEIFVGRNYALHANDIEDIKRIISYWGKTWAKPDFPIIDNIGNYRVSQILADFIKERS